MRYDFASDNAAPMTPEALEALAAANDGYARPYGADETTRRAADRLRELFDADAEVRFVSTGTAANALALAMLARPFECVLAHEEAHVRTDESGAPAFYGQGSGLVGLPGASGRIDREALLATLAGEEVSYRQAPAALTLTQATEYGTLYSPDALRRLIEPARAAGLRIHLDGARLANAVAAGFDAPLVPRLGVDVVSVGGSKAGLACTEAMVIFDPALAVRIDNRLKQAGQLASKTRFLAAPFLGALESGAWIGRAAHANAMAQKLAEVIATNTSLEIAHPVEANMVFVRVSAAQHATLTAAGWACYRFDDGSARFVCSWATDEGAVDELAGALTDLA